MLDHSLCLLQRRLHQKLIDRGTSQFCRTAKRFVDLVGDASTDAILLCNGRSHLHRLHSSEAPVYRCRQNGASPLFHTPPRREGDVLRGVKMKTEAGVSVGLIADLAEVSPRPAWRLPHC